MTVRKATLEDIKRWYNGKLPPVSMKALVMEKEGELLAIAGVQFTRGLVVGFSELRPAAKQDKRSIVLGIREYRKLLQEYDCVITFASRDEPTAGGFIRHVGFRRIATTKNGETYLWEQRQYP